MYKKYEKEQRKNIRIRVLSIIGHPLQYFMFFFEQKKLLSQFFFLTREYVQKTLGLNQLRWRHRKRQHNLYDVTVYSFIYSPSNNFPFSLMIYDVVGYLTIFGGQNVATTVELNIFLTVFRVNLMLICVNMRNLSV